MERATTRVEAADGTELAVEVMPSSGGPTYLLVHGLASNARLWDGVAAELAARGCGVVTVDLRGHGRSSKPDRGFTFETMSDDLVSVIDGVGTGPVIAVGQSFGGNLVLELAARHPDLVSAVGCIDGGFIALRRAMPVWDTVAERLAPPTLTGTPLSQLRFMMSRSFSDWPKQGLEGQLANFELCGDGTVRPWLDRRSHMAILRSLWEHEPTVVIARVQSPVLVIACRGGAPDKVSRVAELVEVGNGVVVEWVDAHHDVHAQYPELVVGLLKQLEA